MADMFQTRDTWLDAQRNANLAHNVAYSRGVDSVTVLASIGRTEFEIDDGNGALIRSESRDFLISAAILILSAALVIPQRGDRIVETIGASTITYEVLAPKNLPHYKYSDASRLVLRIHTKLVEKT